MTDDLSQRLDDYVRERFAREDELLAELRDEIPRRGMPEIHITADLGRLLQVLLASIGARRVLEIGTLGGYSALWMARALPADGRLISLEIDAERAALAREYLERAGLGPTVEVRVGDARELLAGLVAGNAEPFDAVFIDADKESYVEYLERSLELVRPGGLILADNAFRDGRILEDDPDEATRGILAYNDRIAGDDRLISTVVPIRDGLAVSVVAG
ncbi:MAG: methyltransferase domain-containing protein [Gemmatimonadetes bacterium]|nr:O-methyltransferase [Gemmatimonadota bacterium]NIQ52785.1 O-methyltransferase [Gemmatimonadota bacterium]NIU72915.1 methyltransferase domain-containing protein [Gammaproteobacteria bacterium]NIX43275.1 methyltransferase domain-containing protein [Gemmatimonadota bacterium]NIY07452.1 methyltransferase domain-containing protein [Gemmatimonadota bacterium]